MPNCSYTSLYTQKNHISWVALTELGSRRTVKYWGSLSFDLTFLRSKLTSLGCARCVREHYGMKVPEQRASIGSLRKSERADLTEGRSHAASVWHRTGNWSECWWHHARLLTTLHRQFSYLWVVWNLSKTEQKGAGVAGWRSSWILI